MPQAKERKSGIIYFQTLPPNFTVSRMREEMSKFGEIGRIYLQVSFLLASDKPFNSEKCLCSYLFYEFRLRNGVMRKENEENDL